MLRKDYDRVFVPAVPGQEARPQQTVCTQSPPPGSGGSAGQWQYRCNRVTLPRNSGMPIVSVGNTVTVIEVKEGFITLEICGSVWVPYASSGPSEAGPIICVTTPAQPFIPASPARFDLRAVHDWDAGANSIIEVNGNAVLRFDMPTVVGVIVGFVNDRDNPDDKDRITHGIYFGLDGAAEPVFQVVESGRMMTPQQGYSPGTFFRMTRVGGRVRYYVEDGGEELFYTSSEPNSASPLIVGSALHSSGDSIP